MSRRITWTSIALFVTAVILAADRPAYAYIDPGTGSLIIQVLIASLVGAAFAVKTFWRRIAAFLARLFGGQQGRADDE